MLLLAVQLCAALTSANPYLAESKQLYESLRYEKAITRLELARKVTTNTPDERREILDLLARSYVALGQLDQAENAYAELLSKDPHSPAPENAAPKIRQVFQNAKERLYPQTYVKLRAESAPEGDVAVSVIDPWDQITTVILFEDSPGGGFHDAPMKYDAHRAVASFASHDPPHRYFIEARTLDGETRATLGSAEHPIVQAAPVAIVTPPKGEAPPSAEVRAPGPRWLPWSAAGLAAAAAGVGVGFALASNQDASNAGKAPYADDIQRLDRRAHDRAVAANWLVGGAVVAGGAAAVLFFAW